MRVEQRLRILLARLLARGGGRPIATARLVEEAGDAGIAPTDATAALARLENAGNAMHVEAGWLARAPPLPEDVTLDRASRVRLYAPEDPPGSEDSRGRTGPLRSGR